MRGRAGQEWARYLHARVSEVRILLEPGPRRRTHSPLTIDHSSFNAVTGLQPHYTACCALAVSSVSETHLMSGIARLGQMQRAPTTGQAG